MAKKLKLCEHADTNLRNFSVADDIFTNNVEKMFAEQIRWPVYFSKT